MNVLIKDKEWTTNFYNCLHFVQETVWQWGCKTIHLTTVHEGRINMSNKEVQIPTEWLPQRIAHFNLTYSANIAVCLCVLSVREMCSPLRWRRVAVWTLVCSSWMRQLVVGWLLWPSAFWVWPWTAPLVATAADLRWTMWALNDYSNLKEKALAIFICIS